MQDRLTAIPDEIADAALLSYRPVSPRTVLLAAALDEVIGRLATCGKTQNDILLELYRATPLIAVWEIQLTRHGPGFPTPNCLLLAEASEEPRTGFTIVPYRHTYPDAPSQMAWNWCSNFFMAWRWLSYKQILPFPLNEQGRYQFTTDRELEEYLNLAPLTQAQFKQQRRLDYYGIHAGELLELCLDIDWQHYQTAFHARQNQARAELQARGRGEEIHFRDAASELFEVLQQQALVLHR